MLPAVLAVDMVRGKRPVADRTFEISFPAPGIGVYAFTFG